MKKVRTINGWTLITGRSLRLYLLSAMIDDVTVRVTDIFGRKLIVLI